MTHPTDAAIAQANELMACPMCGRSDAVKIRRTRGDEHQRQYVVVCDASTRNRLYGCGTSAGYERSRAEAIAAWNRRTPARELDAEKGGAKYTTGHCKSHAQPGGCQAHNLQCGWPECDRRSVTPTPPAQAAEAVDDDEPPTCPICDCGHFFGRCSDCGFIAPAALNSDMAGALAILANYPVEDFGLEEASDSYGLIGANEWRLTLGDVRKARAAIAAMRKGE